VAPQSALLYDANCNFCMVIAAAILDWDRDGRFYAAAIQDPEGEALLPGMTPDKRLESFHIVDPDGTVRSGGEALPHMFSMLPFGSPVGTLLNAASGVSDRGYRFVARNRITISKAVPQRLKARARARLRG
jgi:predicted DCC family thiol-disulfide oxidoreductase YuxK